MLLISKNTILNDLSFGLFDSLENEVKVKDLDYYLVNMSKNNKLTINIVSGDQHLRQIIIKIMSKIDLISY